MLRQRLLSLCGALGASGVGVARRLGLTDPLAADGPFEVLGAVDSKGQPLSESQRFPPSAYHRVMSTGRLLEMRASANDPLARWLRAESSAYLVGWPLPGDGRVTVGFVARYDSSRRLGEERLRVAHAGLDALARVLAPPAWMPLAPLQPAHEEMVDDSAEVAAAEVFTDLVPLREALTRVERLMLRRALRCAEGNKSDAARRLQLSRQGLYKKLRQHGLL